MRAIENDNWEWGEYRIGDLFEKIEVNQLKLNVRDLPSYPTGIYSLPALTSGVQNQGLNCYVPRNGATILNRVISIASNGDAGATFFQSHDFTVLRDAYAITFHDKNVHLSDKQSLFFASTIHNAIYAKYGWENKANWNKVKNNVVKLPTHDGTPDYALMETLIRAVQKLVIRDVVLYADRKLAATRSVIEGGDR